MSFVFRILLVTTVAITAESAKHPHLTQRTAEQEKAARALVATLLKERKSEASAGLSSSGIVQWIPAASLEAQQGGKAHEEAERELRAEFEEVLGRDLINVFEKDLEGIKKELQATYLAIPKNEYGELGQTGVRYALHRLFVARHGWYIQGIDPEGDHFNESSPADVLKGHVPGRVQQLIEKLLYGRGFGLSEVALLGAILENLIHQEAIQRTSTVFQLLNIDIDTKVDPDEVDAGIDYYMAAYIMGQDVSKTSRQELDDLYNSMPDAYPGWTNTQEFTRKIRESKYGNRDLSFNETVAVVVDIGERHGTWQQKECLDMKNQLTALENQKDGCVPLAHFYRSMREQGKWQFSESPDYLRELGSLEESDPQNMRVMIPNYLDGLSNCVASSSYYSVCCINECEALLGRIERHVQAPDASSQDIARVVAALPSATVPANRQLQPSLVQHLDKIAGAHDGRVPLHSRLFMQWMHNAYPHECPYPHMSGKTTPRLPEVWQAATHKDPTVTRSEMDQFAAQDAVADLRKGGQCGQWLDDEELYVPWHKRALQQEAERDSHIWAGSTSVALFGALASMILMLLSTTKSLRSAACKSSKMIVT